MTLALAKEQQQFITRMIRRGRFHNGSEVVREALRRMENGESDYLTPPPLTAAQVKRIYGGNRQMEADEQRFGRAAFAAVRKASRKGSRP